MDEETWCDADYAQPMLDALRARASDRKLRLFAVACCRRVWDFLIDDRSRAAVETAEAFADGLADRARLIAARDAARDAKCAFVSLTQSRQDRAANAAFDATRDTGRSAASNALHEAARALSFEDHNQCDGGELRQQARLVRCIFGNPSRPTAFDPAWLTPTTIALARTIDADRAFGRMPRLADLLEASGCASTDVLSHCRTSAEHCRGCWVVDAILGKP